MDIIDVMSISPLGETKTKKREHDDHAAENAKVGTGIYKWEGCRLKIIFGEKRARSGGFSRRTVTRSR
jgi:hypothetical protein